MQKYSDSLKDSGAVIKINKKTGNKLMHCKFMIIDNRVLVHGSMNLGGKSLHNYEHVAITDSNLYINKFKRRFDQMWDSDYFYDYTEFMTEVIVNKILQVKKDSPEKFDVMIQDYQKEKFFDKFM